MREFSAFRYGYDAVIVTKKALKLNMARNQISEHDPLWHEISECLLQRSKELSKRSKSTTRVSTLERRNLISLFLTGQLDPELVHEAPLLKDVRGHSLSFIHLLKDGKPLSLCPEAGSRKAERLASAKVANILDPAVMDEYKVSSLESLHALLISTLATKYEVIEGEVFCFLAWSLEQIDIVSFEQLEDNLLSDMRLLESKRPVITI